MSIDQEFKDYLNETLDEKLSEHTEEFKRHTSALAEGFRHDLKAMTEQLPTRTEVREIVREEIAIEVGPIKSDIKVIKLELQDINKILDNHENRIVSLEEAVV